MKQLFALVVTLGAMFFLVQLLSPSYQNGDIVAVESSAYPTLVEIQGRTSLGYSAVVIPIIPEDAVDIQGPYRLEKTSGSLVSTDTRYSSCEFYFTYTQGNNVNSRTYSNCLLLPDGKLVMYVKDINIQKGNQQVTMSQPQPMVSDNGILGNFLDSLLKEEK